MDQFTLTLELGNEAMQSSEDVARALEDISNNVLAGGDGGIIRDENGNTVGHWEFT